MRRLTRNGVPVEQEIQARLLSRILIGGGPGYGNESCWAWTRGKNRDGYGQVSYRGVAHLAHRLSYELFRGPIPEHLQLDHLCENPACVYPGHLEPVAQTTNVLRSPRTQAGRNARKTHCARGHEFTPENTRIDKRGSRVCRACRNADRYARHHGLPFEETAAARPVGADLRFTSGRKS